MSNVNSNFVDVGFSQARQDFTQFQKNDPNWENKLNVYLRDDAIYKRVKITIENTKFKFDNEYHACINTQTGDLYLDCRKRKIMARHLCLSIARPVHTCIKTLWHASVILPLALEIFQLAKGSQSAKDLANHTLKSLKNIVRTPFYGTAITITHVVGVILGCIRPNTLYKTREIAGRLERNMLEVDDILKGGPWVLAPCFSPIDHLFFSQPENNNSVTIQDASRLLDIFGRAQIRFRQNRRAIFNDCMFLHPKNQPYISAAGKK